MAFEDDIEVPSSSNSSFYEFNDNCHDKIDDDDDDDGTFFVSNLMLKFKSLLSRKNHYKHELISLTKEFENLKNEFSSLVKSNDKLVIDLKNTSSLEKQLKKVNDENHKLSNEVLELKSSISRFQKGKETLDKLLESQKPHRNIQGIGYGNRTSTSSSSHINFIKSSSHSTPSSSKPNESQTFQVKRAQVSKAKSNKTQPSRTQRGKVHARNAQLKHAHMYTRHNHHKHVRQQFIPKNTAHFHCNCMSHTMTQKSYRMHPPPQHIRHVSHTRKAYHPRRK